MVCFVDREKFLGIHRIQNCIWLFWMFWLSFVITFSNFSWFEWFSLFLMILVNWYEKWYENWHENWFRKLIQKMDMKFDSENWYEIWSRKFDPDNIQIIFVKIFILNFWSSQCSKLLRPCTKWREQKNKSMSFHQCSWNSEVETT